MSNGLKQFKTTVASYLILKGTWGTFDDEFNNLVDLFGDDQLSDWEILKTNVYRNLLRKLDGKSIKLAPKFPAIVDLWATRRKAEMPLLKMSELSDNVVLLNAEHGKFEFALPFEGQPFVGQ